MAREALACFSAPSNIPEREICFAIVTDPENKGTLCWNFYTCLSCTFLHMLRRQGPHEHLPPEGDHLIYGIRCYGFYEEAKTWRFFLPKQLRRISLAFL